MYFELDIIEVRVETSFHVAHVQFNLAVQNCRPMRLKQREEKGVKVFHSQQTYYNFKFIYKTRSVLFNVPGGGPQTIKIQAIQTNPVTGVKQIVAIPIQAASGPKVSVSPMKVIRLPAPMGGEGSKMVNSGVKVVKLAPGQGSSSTSSPQTFYHARHNQVKCECQSK